ncbi:MAG TPA: PDZ domain-containing protein [Kofleriaceae bacterium]
MNRRIATLFTIAAALPACWSHSPAPSQPTPERHTVVDPPPRKQTKPEELVPVAIFPDESAISGRVCQLFEPEGLGCSMTCVSNCNVHVPFSKRMRARELLQGDPWLVSRIHVVDEAEYQAMIAPPEPLAAEVRVSRAEVDKQIVGRVRLYRPGDSAALCDPICVDSNPSGIMVVSVTSGSLFEKIGLRAQDLIVAVDGQPIDVAGAFRAAQVAKTKNRFRVDLSRKGKAMFTEVVVTP